MESLTEARPDIDRLAYVATIFCISTKHLLGIYRAATCRWLHTAMQLKSSSTYSSLNQAEHMIIVKDD